MPFCSGVSNREPFSTQMPSVTDGTPGISSEMTRKPFGKGERFTIDSVSLFLRHRLFAAQANLALPVDLQHLDENFVAFF